MKRRLLVAGAIGLIACSSSEPTGTAHCSRSGPGGTSKSDFEPIHTLGHRWGDAGPYRDAGLLMPVRRSAGVRIVKFVLWHPWAVAGKSVADEIDKVTAPLVVITGDPVTGEEEERIDIDWRSNRRFGFPMPPDGVVGRFSDPRWLPKDRLELLRQRIFAALDVLLPFFADESRPWTEEANKAAQEVRDFFPLAAEPGLWPYYQAEGREFFSWVERNAPPGKAPLPWEAPTR